MVVQELLAFARCCHVIGVKVRSECKDRCMKVSPLCEAVGTQPAREISRLFVRMELTEWRSVRLDTPVVAQLIDALPILS